MDDRLRAVLDSVFAAPAYDWRERPNPFAFLGRLWWSLVEWLGRAQQNHPALFRLLFWLLAAGFAALVLRALWTLGRAFRTGGDVRAAGAVAPARRGAAWHRAEAQRLAAAGRLVEAMQADFLALVLEFDERRLVRYHPSKTPQEYVREAGLPEAARAELRDLVWGLYRHAFAREPVTAEAAAAWRARTVADRYAPAH